MKKSNIYTRRGDEGTTSLIGGCRVSKHHPRLEAYGTIDELNSQIGLLSTYIIEPEYQDILTTIQNDLFVIGSELATDPLGDFKIPEWMTVTCEMTSRLEQAIDRIDSTIPPLRLFILPGGTRSSSLAHVCRTVCRRAERRILELHDYCLENERQQDSEGQKNHPSQICGVSSELRRYMNRLSDFLFVFARKMNFLAYKDEIIWKKTCD